MIRGLGLAAGTCVALAAPLSTALADCTCRAGGRNYEVGQTACIATAQGFRLAVCDMVLNNTSWRVSPDGCVAAEADSAAPPAGISAAPHRHAVAQPHGG